MDPTQLLFDTASSLTGGLITDMQTLFIGGVVLAFILIGLDHLKEGFENMLDHRAHSRFLENAEDMRMERDLYNKGSAEYDEANYLYRHYIGRAAQTRLRR